MKRAPLARVCKRPSCGNQVPQANGRSRPALFCGDSCRAGYTRERAAARAQLLEAQRLADQYEIRLDQQTRTRTPDPIRSVVQQLQADVESGKINTAQAALETVLKLVSRQGQSGTSVD